jgi:hypothetical protein
MLVHCVDDDVWVGGKGQEKTKKGDKGNKKRGYNGTKKGI